MATVFLGIAAAVGPVLIAIGTLGTAVIGIVGGFSALAGVASSLAPIVAAVTAIAAGLVAATAAAIGLVYSIIGPSGIADAWNIATTAAVSFWKNMVGFITNFQQNMSILWTWLQGNWMSLLEDMFRLWVTFNINMVMNLGTVLKTLVRMYVAWQGFLAGVFEQVFSVEFVHWVVRGIEIAAKKFLEFADRTKEWLQSVFTGQSIDPAAFFKQLQSDFQKGAESTNILSTFGEILKEGAAELRNPLEGFESTIKEGPKFNFDTGEVKAIEQAIRVNEEPLKEVATTIDAIKKATEEPIKIVLKLDGIDAVESGTAEAMARLEAFRHSQAPGIAPKMLPAQGGASEPGGRRATLDGLQATLDQIAANTATDGRNGRIRQRPVVVEDANIA